MNLKSNVAFNPKTEAAKILAEIANINFNIVKDKKLHAVVQTICNLLKTIAANTETSREATLLADFEKQVLDLKAASKAVGIVSNHCDDQLSKCPGSPSYCNFNYASCLLFAIYEYNKPKI